MHSPHGGLVPPLILLVGQSKDGNLSLDVAWGHRVDTSETGPLDSKTLACDYKWSAVNCGNQPLSRAGDHIQKWMTAALEAL